MNVTDRSFHPTHIDLKTCSIGHANTDTRTHRSRYSYKRKRRHMHTTKDPQRTKDRVWTAQTQDCHILNVHPVEPGQTQGFTTRFRFKEKRVKHGNKKDILYTHKTKIPNTTTKYRLEKLVTSLSQCHRIEQKSKYARPARHALE